LKSAFLPEPRFNLAALLVIQPAAFFGDTNKTSSEPAASAAL
jgi:hypothetical protein